MRNNKKLKIYNYPDSNDKLCVWVGEVVSGDGKSPDTIIKMKNSKKEIKEEFLGNLDVC